MGKRGPAGQMEKAAAGTQVKETPGTFPAPAYLTPLAKEYWRNMVAAFPGGYFTNADRVLLEQYCEAAALHRNATAILRKEGRRYKDKNGVLRKNPAVDDQHQARCDCAMLATKLRITKTSMISPKVAGRAAQEAAAAADGEDTFQDLLFGGPDQARQ